ncbi:MAG: molybdate ABC transporter permease subunit [Deferribacteraceae bacterium]|jgi:molybdate transport system permease protein|nr:molybdate ABC transporter permease subunit [Deferribacteraceae bacterium]
MNEFFRLTPSELEAVRLSLLVGFTAVTGSFPFGIFFGWLLARREFPGKSALDALLHLPLVIPPVVTGYILLILFGRRGALGGFLYNIFGFTFAFNWKGAALASAVIAFPLMVRSIRISMESVDRGLESAARTLGAGRVKVFFTITIPLSFTGILAGVVMAFARSLGEFGATITFVSNIPGETRTLPLALYSQLQMPGGEFGAARLCAVALIIAFISMILSEYFARRNRKRYD